MSLTFNVRVKLTVLTDRAGLKPRDPWRAVEGDTCHAIEMWRDNQLSLRQQKESGTPWGSLPEGLYRGEETPLESWA